MEAPQATLLKHDALGRVELLTSGAGERAIRRVACGGRIPGSRVVARLLMARERRALHALSGLAGVPRVIDAAEFASARGVDGRVPRARDVLVRSFVAGDALSRARELPQDFFDELDRLLTSLHARGVCHNDLHKEGNVIVGDDGWPHLVDFQLASVQRVGRASFARRVREDLRHVQKHRRRYTRAGRGAEGVATRGLGAELQRGALARAWMRFGKPVYLFVTRTLLRTSDGERPRPSRGPWPRWTQARGPRT